MRGRSWIRQLRLADAQQLRQEIAQLEGELVSERAALRPRRLTELGYHIHSRKWRLHRLEHCISALQAPDQQ
ncbi:MULTISPECIES: hypothetical protein [unclassified Mesorhizobium]|uniref:hypothetical protein n=1 Tax=unclassified Mesorhizobium TaxID=325217 RepID=UPI00112EEDC7|nr:MULTISPECIES: hypothetical protein [unclassified Mesorhizobium]MBZ9894423.1 hypothetical protein [Mesorhizobium sp. BR1-1-6]TPM57624.1 hypothetical protein FJ959_12630 [Mesorhizobium sp. B2-2-4]TPM65573.1 hypothetical protein FJ965_15205 [Mesorhizobium sp. B2-2-1]TPN38517.1 hypothetical protein FJ979_14415 [Mesorhizobium sp. B1-1-6]TPN71899.1 hypothetical protein FJ984_03185 [Mesorhizobium sp. B1-1-3]